VAANQQAEKGGGIKGRGAEKREGGENNSLRRDWGDFIP